jgi:hypothetical protein
MTGTLGRGDADGLRRFKAEFFTGVGAP